MYDKKDFFSSRLNFLLTVSRRRSPEREAVLLKSLRSRGSKPYRKNRMKMKRKLALVLAKAFSGKPAPEKKREKEVKASKKLEAWLKASRMRSF